MSTMLKLYTVRVIWREPNASNSWFTILHTDEENAEIAAMARLSVIGMNDSISQIEIIEIVNFEPGQIIHEELVHVKCSTCAEEETIKAEAVKEIDKIIQKELARQDHDKEMAFKDMEMAFKGTDHPSKKSVAYKEKLKVHEEKGKRIVDMVDSFLAGDI